MLLNGYGNKPPEQAEFPHYFEPSDALTLSAGGNNPQCAPAQQLNRYP
jgi:hypothetical protein